MATLSAWPPIIPNQAPRKEEWIRCRTEIGRELQGRSHGSRAKRNHGKEAGLDGGKLTMGNGKMEFSAAILVA